jgi:hypothetical protein
MAERIRGGKMYYPPEDKNNPNDREILHPETDSKQVLMENGETLADAISNTLIVSETKPEQACIWGKITQVRRTTT